MKSVFLLAAHGFVYKCYNRKYLRDDSLRTSRKIEHLKKIKKTDRLIKTRGKKCNAV